MLLDRFWRQADGSWARDVTAQDGPWGPRVSPTGLHRGYQPPAEHRVRSTFDERGARYICPRCHEKRPITWDKLFRVLDTSASAGVERLTLAVLAATLRRKLER